MNPAARVRRAWRNRAEAGQTWSAGRDQPQPVRSWPETLAPAMPSRPAKRRPGGYPALRQRTTTAVPFSGGASGSQPPRGEGDHRPISVDRKAGSGGVESPQPQRMPAPSSSASYRLDERGAKHQQPALPQRRYRTGRCQAPGAVLASSTYTECQAARRRHINGRVWFADKVRPRAAAVALGSIVVVPLWLATGNASLPALQRQGGNPR